MSVVIDEFDVVAREGQSNPPSAPPVQANTAGSAPTAHDIEQVIEWQCERNARIWAH